MWWTNKDNGPPSNAIEILIPISAIWRWWKNRQLKQDLEEINKTKQMNFTITSVMAILTALPQFIQLIRELMTLAQDEFGKGTGPTKKDVIISGVQNIIGDDSVWNKVKSVVSILIDFLAVFKTKDDTTTPTA